MDAASATAVSHPIVAPSKAAAVAKQKPMVDEQHEKSYGRMPCTPPGAKGFLVTVGPVNVPIRSVIEAARPLLLSIDMETSKVVRLTAHIIVGDGAEAKHLAGRWHSVRKWESQLSCKAALPSLSVRGTQSGMQATRVACAAREPRSWGFQSRH